MKLVGLFSLLSLCMASLLACDGTYLRSAQHGIESIETPPEVKAAQNCDPARSQFRQDLYPRLKQSCGDCHSVDEFPQFASANLDLAFKRSTTQIDFSEVRSSNLLIQASNDHCNNAACRDPKPELEKSLTSFVDLVRQCQVEDSLNSDPEAGFRQFVQITLPALQNQCGRCHAGSIKGRSFYDKFISKWYEAPSFLEGDLKSIYGKTRKYLAIEKDSFYASPLYGAAIFLHFQNGTCSLDPELEQEEQSPCREIADWWEVEQQFTGFIEN